MPIYEFGYRPWQGVLRHRWLRWWPITRTGIGMALRNRILRRLLFFAWAPILYFGPLFFAIGNVTESNAMVDDRAPGPAPGRPHAGQNTLWHGMVQGMVGPDVSARLRTDPQSVRPAIWSLAFHYFMGYSQTVVMMLVVAIVGPPLVSQDVRSKAFLMYFSRPITRWDYIVGKGGTLFGYVAFVTLLPALALYSISIAFSPSFAVLIQTSLILVRIIAAALVVGIPATLIMLYFSSLVREPRYAGFAWVATLVLGIVFHRVLQLSPGLRDASWPFVLSLRELWVVAVSAIFDAPAQFKDLGMASSAMALRHNYSAPLAFAMLTGISVVCLFGLMRRVTAPLRI